MNLEQRALASTVAADDAEHFSLLNFEVYISQRPECLDLVALHDLLATGGVDQLPCKITCFSRQHFTETRVLLTQAMSDRIALGEFFNCDDGILSRITDPTEGRITLHGRASSLLELDGQDLRREPLETRKATLASLLRGSLPGLRATALTSLAWGKKRPKSGETRQTSVLI